ncbi:MAG: radical SAM protein, partial [Ruminiclostridium sp.]|nr:radical SAM protein [Ruminiclostridium sp.]
MKIAVIRLNMFEHISSDAMKPIFFGIIKSLTPARHEIRFYDERTDPLPERIDADIVAFSVETFTAKRAYILARRYKACGAAIVMGGFHAAVMAEEMSRYADTVLVGDAEGVWASYLDDFERGEAKRLYTSDENAPLAELPPYTGDRTVYRHSYHGIGVHQLSRGCRFDCGFCSIKTMYRCVRRKPTDMIVRELKASREKIIFFADDNIFYDRSSAVELFTALIPLKKKWACQISMDAARDGELLDLMKRSGCFLVLMGFESLNRESLKEMRKAANLASDYETLIKNIYRRGMMIYGTFVLGCDGDDRDVF